MTEKNENEQKSVNPYVKMGFKVLLIFFVAVVVFFAWLNLSLKNAFSGLSQPTPPTNGIVSIFTDLRYQNTNEGNKLIHSNYGSLEEFNTNGDQVRYLGNQGNHIKFEVFIPNLANNKRSYAMFTKGYAEINRMTAGEGDCSEAKQISSTSFEIKGGVPTIVCMPRISEDSIKQFAAFGNLAEASSSGEDEITLNSESGTLKPSETTPMHQWSVLLTNSTNKGPDVKYRYEQIEETKVQEEDKEVIYTLIHMRVEIPSNYKGIFPKQLPKSKICYQLNGVSYCINESIDGTVKLREGLESFKTFEEKPNFMEMKKGQSFNYVRIFKKQLNQDSFYLIDNINNQSITYLKK